MTEQPNFDKMEVLDKGTKFECAQYTLNGELHRLDGPAREYADGTKEWFENGERHRTDGPAFVGSNGNKEWYQNGKLHRVDGPAFVSPNGNKFWYQNGKLHRKDDPALEWADGRKEWYQNGKLHRKDGPAIEYADGGKSWYLNGKKLTEEEFNERIGMTEQPNFDKKEILDKGEEDERTVYTLNGKWHRTDGPAIVWANGTKFWFKNSEPHRADGPAIVWADGHKEWYIEGEGLTEQEFNERVKNEKLDRIENLLQKILNKLEET